MITQYIDTIISACVPFEDTEDSRNQAQKSYNKIVNSMDEGILSGAAFILYKTISRSYDNGIKIDWEYIRTMTETNAKRFIRDKNVGIKEMFPDTQVALLGDPQVEREVVGQLLHAVEEKYNEYKGKEVMSTELNAAVDIMKETIKIEHLKRILKDSVEILFEGKDVLEGKIEKYMEGSDALNYALSELGKLAGKDDNGTDGIPYVHLDSYEKLEQLKMSDDRGYDVCLTTGIPLLDDAIEAFYTSQVLGLQGLPGVGKSRFAAMLMYRGISVYKRNVFYMSNEQHCNELEAYFSSQHCWYKYGVYITDKQLKQLDVIRAKKKRMILTEEDFAKMDMPVTLEEMSIITEAQLDFYTDPEYGELFLDNSYTPIEKLENHIRNINNNIMKIDIACIDHMSILTSDGSLSGGMLMTPSQIVQMGMLMLKKLAQKLNMFVIAVNQMTRDEADRIQEGKKSRISGSANSSEFERTSDIMITIGATPSLDEVDKVFLDMPKARDSGKTSRIILETKKGICLYEQDVNQNE